MEKMNSVSKDYEYNFLSSLLEPKKDMDSRNRYNNSVIQIGKLNIDSMEEPQIPVA